MLAPFSSAHFLAVVLQHPAAPSPHPCLLPTRAPATPRSASDVSRISFPPVRRYHPRLARDRSSPPHRPVHGPFQKHQTLIEVRHHTWHTRNATARNPPVRPHNSTTPTCTLGSRNATMYNPWRPRNSTTCNLPVPHYLRNSTVPYRTWCSIPPVSYCNPLPTHTSRVHLSILTTQRRATLGSS